MDDEGDPLPILAPYHEQGLTLMVDSGGHGRVVAIPNAQTLSTPATGSTGAAPRVARPGLSASRLSPAVRPKTDEETIREIEDLYASIATSPAALQPGSEQFVYDEARAEEPPAWLKSYMKDREGP